MTWQPIGCCILVYFSIYTEQTCTLPIKPWNNLNEVSTFIKKKRSLLWKWCWWETLFKCELAPTHLLASRTFQHCKRIKKCRCEPFNRKMTGMYRSTKRTRRLHREHLPMRVKLVIGWHWFTLISLSNAHWTATWNDRSSQKKKDMFILNLYYYVHSRNFNHIRLFKAPFLENLWDDWHDQEMTIKEKNVPNIMITYSKRKDKSKICKHFPFELNRQVALNIKNVGPFTLSIQLRLHLSYLNTSYDDKKISNCSKCLNSCTE